jgi:hypothetical protein
MNWLQWYLICVATLKNNRLSKLPPRRPDVERAARAEQALTIALTVQIKVQLKQQHCGCKETGSSECWSLPRIVKPPELAHSSNHTLPC